MKKPRFKTPRKSRTKYTLRSTNCFYLSERKTKRQHKRIQIEDSFMHYIFDLLLRAVIHFIIQTYL